MKKKRSILLFFFIILGISLISSCKSKEKEEIDINQFLISESIQLTSEMRELGKDEIYIKLRSSSSELIDIISNITDPEYKVLKQIYMISFSSESIAKIIKDMLELEVSEQLISRLIQMSNGTFASIWNGRYAANIVAAASLINVEKSYIKPENWVKNTWIILDYKEEFSSLVSFVETGEGVISGAANFIKSGEDGVEATLKMASDFINLEYQKYTEEQLEEILQK